MRFAGDSVEPAEEVRRLVRSWEAHGLRDGADPTKDLERLPWLEETGDGVHVVFEARPGNRTWMKWPSSFMAWVRSFGGEMQPAAMVDLVGGSVRATYVAPRRPNPSAGGPANDEDWAPGQGAESVPMLYREMMNTAVSPLLRSMGYRRKGQSFDKQRNGTDAYVIFQKDRWNTKFNVSFTINVSVVNTEVIEDEMRAVRAAAATWKPYPTFIPARGQWGGRVGHILGLPDQWWTIRSREEMREVSRSVLSVLREEIWLS